MPHVFSPSFCTLCTFIDFYIYSAVQWKFMFRDAQNFKSIKNIVSPGYIAYIHYAGDRQALIYPFYVIIPCAIPKRFKGVMVVV